MTTGLTLSRSQSYVRDARVMRRSATPVTRVCDTCVGASRLANEWRVRTPVRWWARRARTEWARLRSQPRALLVLHHGRSGRELIDTDDLSWWTARRWGWGGWWWWRAWITRVISSTVTVWASRKLWFYRSRTAKASGLCCEELKVSDILPIFIIIFITTQHAPRAQSDLSWWRTQELKSKCSSNLKEYF